MQPIANHDETDDTPNSVLVPPIYIEEGYSIMRTEAPKERAGRGVENLARTTPELP
jgi:hypothetical protein